MHFQPEAVRGGRLALDLDEALRVTGEAQTSIALPAGRLPGFRLELVVELDRVLQELRDIGGSAELSNETGGMASRTGGDIGALQHHGIGPAIFAEMKGGAAADDAAADDDRTG